LGKTVTLGAGRKDVLAEIVGVVPDVRLTGPRNEPDDLIYSTYTQSGRGFFSLVIQTRGNPVDMMASVKREIRAVDRNQTLKQFYTMSDSLAGEVAEPRFYLVLLAGYGLLALVLTAVGIGGLVAYAVSRRTQEIGLRISFGATSGNLLIMFGAGAFRLALAGLVLGVPSSFVVTRLLKSLLFEVTPSDPATLGAVGMVLIGVSLAAGCGAAFRATRVEPVVVLRHE
jgi:ABC-type antimicrobial peptide transport system permease subunit